MNELPWFWWLRRRADGRSSRYVCPLLMTLTGLWHAWVLRRPVAWRTSAWSTVGDDYDPPAMVHKGASSAWEVSCPFPVWMIKLECWAWDRSVRIRFWLVTQLRGGAE